MIAHLISLTIVRQLLILRQMFVLKSILICIIYKTFVLLIKQCIYIFI